MIKELEYSYKLRESKGQLPKGMANRLLVATILEAGIVAFHKGFYGDAAWNDTKNKLKERRQMSAREAQHQGEQIVGNLQEALCSDVRSLARLCEAHTTADFGHILADLRDRTVRRDLNPIVDSPLMQFATKRTAPNFRPMRSLRFDQFDQLIKRAEGTNVKYAKFGETEDQYSVCNYELAFGYTWEMYVDDDLSVVQIAMENLGLAARRTRALVLLKAVYAKTNGNRVTLTAGAGGPDIDHLKQLRTVFANIKTTDGKKNLGYKLTDIVVPQTWDDVAYVAINSEKMTVGGVESANPVYKRVTSTEDRMMSEIFGDDWIGFDSGNPFCEFATLKGYEGGPRTFTKVPDVVETIDQGSFDSHELAIKVSDNIGATVSNDKAVKQIRGS